jgi:hypothetical protein
VSFATIILCVASQRVFIIVSIYFFINSVWKLLDTPSYSGICKEVVVVAVVAAAVAVAVAVGGVYFSFLAQK